MLLMSAWKWNAYMYKYSKWWRQTTGPSMRPTRKSLECLHLWDRNPSASSRWSLEPPDVSGRCRPTSVATLPPARPKWYKTVFQTCKTPFSGKTGMGGHPQSPEEIWVPQNWSIGICCISKSDGWKLDFHWWDTPVVDKDSVDLWREAIDRCSHGG